MTHAKYVVAEGLFLMIEVGTFAIFPIIFGLSGVL